MADNLYVSTFRNGDSIPEAKSGEEWYQFHGDPGCFTVNVYSRNFFRELVSYKFYNLAAISDPRGLVPIGWRIPNREDCDRLKRNCESTRDTLLFKKLFSIGAGKIYHDGTYSHGGEYYWLFPTRWPSDRDNPYVGINGLNIYVGVQDHLQGLSVRCIKD